MMNCVRSICVFAVMAICAVQVSAQTVVRGKVVDEEGIPIPGARVSIKGAEESVLTGFDGAFRMISSVADGELIVEYVGYNTTKAKLTAAETVIMKKTTLWNEIDKCNWLVSFQMGFPEIENMQPSFGAMLGWCKRYGYYIKGIWRNNTEAIVESGKDPSEFWTTGTYTSAFKALTAGAILRLESPFHLYAGAGMTNREVSYGVSGIGNVIFNKAGCDGEWKLGFDVGMMFKIRYFMINAGVLWTPERPGMVGNLGIGVSF